MIRIIFKYISKYFFKYISIKLLLNITNNNDSTRFNANVCTEVFINTQNVFKYCPALTIMLYW